MKVVISPQAFKGSLTGMEAARAMAEAVQEVFPGAETVLLPVADGGDGTLQTLVEVTGGQFFTSRVTGPLGEPVDAQWGATGDGRTAIIEMARASGLVLVPPDRKDPRVTTTYGTGQLINQALERGYQHIILGIGGSATNDGGAGVAQAVGYRLLDAQGRDLPFGGAALARLARIDPSRRNPRLEGARVTAATDVNNPLCGPRGASAVYGPQKGATPEMVQELDRALAHLAEVVKRDLGVDAADTPGAGAAGGLGFGVMVFLKGELRPGIDMICDLLGLERYLEGASLVLTGEGMIDASTMYNKAPIGVARRAKARGIPVVAVAGSKGKGYEGVFDQGVQVVEAMVEGDVTVEEAMARPYQVLREATVRALRRLVR